MTFDPMKFYEDEQRKQKRYDSLLPVFLVAVVMLVAFYGFFVAYQRSHHATPKPYTLTVWPTQSGGFEPGHVIGNPDTVWLKCDAGEDVTDLKDCPEYEETRALNEGRALLVGTRPRKHKRKAEQWSYDPSPARYIFDGCESLGGSSGPGYSQTTFKCDGIDVQMIWGQAPRAEAKVPGITWSTTPLPAEPYNPLAHDGDMGSHRSPPAGYTTTPADITNLMEQIAPTKPAGCPPAPVGDGDFYVDSDGCIRLTFTPMTKACADATDESCRWSVARVTPDKSMKPDCKMPADVDVCPVQMLDPKDISDEKGKP